MRKSTFFYIVLFFVSFTLNIIVSYSFTPWSVSESIYNNLKDIFGLLIPLVFTLVNLVLARNAQKAGGDDIKTFILALTAGLIVNYIFFYFLADIYFAK